MSSLAAPPARSPAGTLAGGAPRLLHAVQIHSSRGPSMQARCADGLPQWAAAQCTTFSVSVMMYRHSEQADSAGGGAEVGAVVAHSWPISGKRPLPQRPRPAGDSAEPAESIVIKGRRRKSLAPGDVASRPISMKIDSMNILYRCCSLFVTTSNHFLHSVNVWGKPPSHSHLRMTACSRAGWCASSKPPWLCLATALSSPSLARSRRNALFTGNGAL